MNRERVRLARRMVAIAAFREERARQDLASARHASSEADEALGEAVTKLEAMQSLRGRAMSGAGDVDAWLRYGVLEEMADGERVRAADERAEAHARENEATSGWAGAKATLDASEERSRDVRETWLRDTVRSEMADVVDAWLAREASR